MGIRGDRKGGLSFDPPHILMYFVVLAVVVILVALVIPKFGGGKIEDAQSVEALRDKSRYRIACEFRTDIAALYRICPHLNYCGELRSEGKRRRWRTSLPVMGPVKKIKYPALFRLMAQAMPRKSESR